MEIKNSYLIWIGSEHYETIESWVAEATEQGVSKRLPNEHIAKSLLSPGTVVFVAHDEGKHDDCPECSKEIECPACRRSEEAAKRETTMAKHLEKEAASLKADSKEHASLARRAANARKRSREHTEERESCEDCLGSGRITSGSGGHVAFGDGETWDYRRYNYFLHQPKKWSPEEKDGILEISMCEHCGGKGELPKGVVFGLFVPERLEYIDAGDPDKAAALVAAGFDVVSSGALKAEKARKCGRRKPGGVYAVTGVESKSEAGKLAAEALGLASGEIEVHGNFVRFLRPVAIPGTKRCRGLAKFELSPELAEEAEMIAEASE